MTTEDRPRITFKTIAAWVLWAVGLGIIINEIFLVPYADFRLEVVILGGVMAQLPGADRIWAARTGAPAPPEPPVSASPAPPEPPVSASPAPPRSPSSPAT